MTNKNHQSDNNASKVSTKQAQQSTPAPTQTNKTKPAFPGRTVVMDSQPIAFPKSTIILESFDINKKPEKK